MSVAIVLGGARGALADLMAAEAFAPGAPIIAVNDALRAAPRKPVAFATLHPEEFDSFAGGVDMCDVRIFASGAVPGYPVVRSPDRFGGSSGLFAAIGALRYMQFAGVILAGVPMEATARHMVSKGLWSPSHVERYQRGWVKADAALNLRPRVRSMSGWTRSVFGAPDVEWIEGLSQSGAAAHIRA